MLVDRKVDDQSLEALVLLFQLLETAQLGHAHAGELPSPAVEGLLANAYFSAGLHRPSCPPRPGAGRNQFVLR